MDAGEKLNGSETRDGADGVVSDDGVDEEDEARGSSSGEGEGEEDGGERGESESDESADEDATDDVAPALAAPGGSAGSMGGQGEGAPAAMLEPATAVGGDLRSSMPSKGLVVKRPRGTTATADPSDPSGWDGVALEFEVLRAGKLTTSLCRLSSPYHAVDLTTSLPLALLL